jgi:hypothetical protein
MSAYTYKGVPYPSMESVVAEIVREMTVPIDLHPAHEVFTRSEAERGLKRPKKGGRTCNLT